MPNDLLTGLGLRPEDIRLSSIELVQKSIEIYEQTINAMGIVQYETMSEAINNSEILYSSFDTENQYGNLSKNY